MSSSKSPPKPINLLKYHRPRLHLKDAKIPQPNAEARRCLRNLASYRPRKPLIKFPRSKCAAVLVAIFVGRSGDLYVLLNRRSVTLRSYAGDTSLPGGKVEDSDLTFEDTARREAFEEIGLPRDKSRVPLLCVLDPFIASEQLIVTPIVVLILDNTLHPILNTAEVTSLFSHPLVSFLSSTPPFSELVEVSYHTFKDFSWSGAPFSDGTRRKTRSHSFLTGRETGGIKPVYGLTAAIMIHTAKIGYAPRVPDFEEQPPGAPRLEERLAWAFWRKPEFKEACEKEGIFVNWNLIHRVAKVDQTVNKNRVQGRARSKL